MDKLTEKWLNEAITFSPEMDGKNVYDKVPVLKDSDVVRVYHGFYDNKHAYEFCKYGASGKELASRVYSFESNNNPYGLFVTSDFRKAKEFSRPTAGVAVIIEFNTKVANLESPVWPSGGYTVQGQMSQYWKGDTLSKQMADREQGRLRDREDIKKSSRSDLDFAKKSDRPELAKSLFYSSEYQALFVGDLNPNMIRAVWVYEGTADPKYGTFNRMPRNDFLRKYGKLETKAQNWEDRPGDKIYNPNENWAGMDDFVKRFNKRFRYDRSDGDYVKRTVDDYMKTAEGRKTIFSQFRKNLWPKQIKQAVKDIGINDADYFVP